jgi:hypothetical protein
MLSPVSTVVDYLTCAWPRGDTNMSREMGSV